MIWESCQIDPSRDQVGAGVVCQECCGHCQCPVCLWQSNEELGSPLPTGNCHHMLHIYTKHQSKLSNSSERVAQMVNE